MVFQCVQNFLMFFIPILSNRGENMKFKTKLISILLITVIGFSILGSTNASSVSAEKIVHLGDRITLSDITSEKGTHYPTIFINGVQLWSLYDQCSLCWKNGWTDNIITDLRNNGLVDANGVFINHGLYSKTYKWNSGFFNQNSHTTTFKFAVLSQ